jgi:biotin-independent malonate decarboxylase gamma subunit
VSRGSNWFVALTESALRAEESVQTADTRLGDERVQFVCVVPNPAGRFPRARAGQVGIEEGWKIAETVHSAVAEDASGNKRAIVLIVDVPGQAFGYNEEVLGLHESLAAAADAYATARDAGHPVIALVVGKAISGAFLAHGLQAGAIIALDDAALEFHVMSQASVARVTRRGEAEVAELAKIIPSTARDVHSFASLGALNEIVPVDNAASPTSADVERLRAVLVATTASLRERPRAPCDRLDSDAAKTSRAASRRVRELLKAQWDASA